MVYIIGVTTLKYIQTNNNICNFLWLEKLTKVKFLINCHILTYSVCFLQCIF